jgi:hypothetical protein
MLRSSYTSHQQGYSKPVDYFRPLTVDVSVEYELPKEVAPPPGSAPLLIIHPSAYYQNRKTATAAVTAPALSSILSPSHTRSNSSIIANNISNASSSSYYLRSHNAPMESASAAVGVAAPTAQIYSRSSTRTSSSVSRSRSMSMAVGAERAEKQQQGCGDPFCDECIKKSKVKGQQNPTPFTISYYGNQQQQQQQQKMELDLTPTKAKAATSGIKRLRMSQQQREREVQKLQNQILGIGELPLNLAVSQALPLVDPSLYLGASLSYRHQQPPHQQPPPLYATRGGVGGGGNTGIFQMINNVYAQQGSGGSGRLIFKEGPKGSGSDSGVCSENESDVSPSNSNNNHSRRNLFSSVGDNNVVNNGGGSGSGKKFSSFLIYILSCVRSKSNYKHRAIRVYHFLKEISIWSW